MIDDDGERPTGKPPCLYVSHPDSPHGWTDDRGGVTEMLVLHFRTVPEELAAVIKPAKTFMAPLKAAELKKHRRWLDEACQAKEAGDAAWRVLFERVLLEVTLLVTGRAGPPDTAETSADRVRQALQWYEENMEGNPSVEEAARAAGVTRGHLRRLFLEAGRNAPKVEFSRLRMALAQRCLLRGWTLERIADYLGFSDASALSRSFREVCGRSPRRWRAESPERARADELV